MMFDVFRCVETLKKQLPSRRENHGFSVSCQFGSLENLLLFTIHSEGSHVDRRLRGHEENSPKMMNN